ncbi:MAG: ThiF family adenylyltransferase [Verrucomicrobiales bacterium]|nr:ThiF family adenylyltransferase [Verrucomicrobiales bacterium]
MAQQSELTMKFPELDSRQSCLIRVAESERKKFEKLLFQRHPAQEWGSFFRFGFRQTPWGLAASFISPMPPMPGELDRQSSIVSFRSQYISRAVKEVENTPFGIGIAHSHPHGWGVSPSSSDDDMDEYFADLFGSFGKGRPYCSLILNRNREGELVFSGRAFHAGKWLPVSELITPNFPYIRIKSAEIEPPFLANLNDKAESGESVIARFEELYGSIAAAKLRGSRIAIIGCSGTGSPAIECLARAGVSEFVIADYQRFGKSNLERIHGSRFAHTKRNPLPYKVELMAEMIWEINPSAKITAFVGNILDDEVVNEMLRCDLLLGCTDTHHGRAALSDLATRFLLPSIDVGVMPEGRGGKMTAQLIEVTRYASELPCAFCSGSVSTWPLTVECMTEEDRKQRKEAADEANKRGEDGTVYWNGDVPQLPTVGYLTTNAGSLAAGYAINWLVGSCDLPHSRFQFDIGQPEFGFAVINRKRSASCACGKIIGHGDQGDAEITKPPHWPRPIKLSLLQPSER